MRVGIIRGDLPGPLFMADLETHSQTSFPTEPFGQTRYVSRPNTTNLGAALAVIPATIASASAVTFPLAITNGNHTLRIRTSSSGSFVVVTVANSSYTTMTTLVAAVTAALVAGSVAATAGTDSSGTLLLLESNALGPGAYLETDTTGNGSTFNTPANFAAGGSVVTIPTVATVIAATLPVGGPLDVRTATLQGLVGLAASATTLTAIADAIAPRFIETDVAIKSFQVGNLSKYLEATFTPDPTRLPAIVQGAAVTVVQDDGNTVFTAGLPNITGAAHNVPNTGDLTITGTGLANIEFFDATTIHITNPTTNAFVRAFQKVINKTVSGGTTGSVTATSIVIPASLLNGLSAVGNKVQLQYTSFVSNVFTIT